MSNRNTLATIALETIETIDLNRYFINGNKIELEEALNRAMEGTEVLNAKDEALSEWPHTPSPQLYETTTTAVQNCTTLEAAREQFNKGEGSVGVLNFASAKNPGGGFLNGSQAQEESIARSSGLYKCLTKDEIKKNFYEVHTKYNGSGFYSHAMIYSPEVPVFRLDDGTWIDRYNISIVTSPAVNAGVVRSRIHRKDVDKQINEAMYERMARILQLFELKRIPILILGSFGTGVFKNDPELVAKAWSELLSGRFKNSFKHVVMAIKDYKTFSTFQKHFLIK